MTEKKLKTMDGNTAAAYASYAFTEVAAIYPITPSSTMAEVVDEWSSSGKKNVFGQTVKVVEMQSEAGAAGAMHGSLQAGALTTTYTASQGLLLMIPNMYKMAGELLPGVFHVSARALAAHALSIFGDHQDVMAARQTGLALFASSNVQEALDLGMVAHLAAIKGRLPFIHFFDGFRTSHEIQKIELIDYEDIKKIIDWDSVNSFRSNALNPDHPVLRGTAQNPDIYFQGREASNRQYEALPYIVETYLEEIKKITGREYHLFDYYGAHDAERLIIAMGSVCDTISETVDYLNSQGEKVGLLNVHLYRPFSIEHFLKSIPDSVKKIAVLDRTKEPGSLGEPLYLDVVNSMYDFYERPIIVGGRYGLGSKDVLPADIIAVFDNLKSDQPKNGFTIGIHDDVTGKSLHRTTFVDTTPLGTKACKFWGLGSDGTVGANKSAIKIIGDKTDMFAQGYFSYDSKKSGGITISHLRFGSSPIKSPYLIQQADFISCSNQSYVGKYDLLKGLKPGGKFLLNCIWDEKELEEHLPAKMKRILAKNNIEFYTINAVKIAEEIGLGGRINMVMQSAFFKIAQIIPINDAMKYLKDAVVTSYGSKGQKVVDMNVAAIDKGVAKLKKINVPAMWQEAIEKENLKKEVPGFIEHILEPMNRQEGDDLPVSAFVSTADGTFPMGTAAFEKRGIAVNVPEWQMEHCIQCNQCAYVCPHAVVRPMLLDDEEKAQAPAGFLSKEAVGAKGMHFSLQISPLDCTGCGNCAQVCPAPKGKALVMKPIASQEKQIGMWDFVQTIKPKSNPVNKVTVKGSQFEKPLLEFSGACAGCGETPYAKLVTQLFGDRMMIANATGCSSIWGGSAPSVPYTTNHLGHGPAWANSLFEDNAEFGLGMLLGANAVRERLAREMNEALDLTLSAKLKEAIKKCLDNFDLGDKTRERADIVIELLEKEKGEDLLLNLIYEKRDFLVKRSQWIFGGDGWAYDIGYGGLDHVLASNQDVNVLVFDTEVYSNTGGQASKSTNTGAVAQFAASGKMTKKKDLGMMAMSYGYVYVAQIGMGADMNQTIKAITEAEAYPGPSLIIAYAPCINHGLKAGMGASQQETKNAVLSGYWANYRYNPQLKDKGENPFILDSKEPTASYRDFLKGEVRYTSLEKKNAKMAEELYARTEKEAKERLAIYQKLASK